MKVTPAQIEAAAKKMRYIDHEHYNENWYHTLAEAALTAAAEVDMREGGIVHLDPGTHTIRIADDANATIERCAQVVRDLYPHDDRYDEVVAAIEALKDK